MDLLTYPLQSSKRVNNHNLLVSSSTGLLATKQLHDSAYHGTYCSSDINFSVVPDHLLHPYSRSHNRREKRKAKNQLAGGELNAIATALSEAIGEEPPTIHVDKKGREIKKDETELREERRKREAEKGKIGEGKGRTMNETKRRKQM